MAAGRPARALLDSQRVVRAADEQPPAAGLLEMAFQTKVGITFRQHFRVYRAVGGMADRATFARRLVFERVGSALGGVTAETALVLAHQRSAATEIHRTFMGRVAIGAAHLPLRNGVVARQRKLG